jgi:hypothetical protein
VKKYSEIQTANLHLTKYTSGSGLRSYWKSLYFEKVDKDFLQTFEKMLKALIQNPLIGNSTQVTLDYFGGKFTDAKYLDSSFGIREKPRFALQIIGRWRGEENDIDGIETVKNLAKEFDRFIMTDVPHYFNAVSEFDETMNHSKSQLKLLQDLKAKYDANGVFSGSLNRISFKTNTQITN